MKLSNFEEFIEDLILERGFNYFIKDRISSIEEMEKGHFRAVVAGSEAYAVEVRLGTKGKITELSCDCPYDRGEFCKHQAAVLYALNDMNDKGAREDNKSGKTKKGQESDITQQNPELGKQLLFRYTAGADETAASKKLIREYINRAKHRGFIEWNKAGYAMEGAWQVLEKARAKSECGDAVGGVYLCITVLSIVVDALQYCDDSGGDVGSVINESIGLINETAGVKPAELGVAEQKKLFNIIFKEALSKRYEGWSDWKFDLLGVCTNFCGIPECRAILEKQLNQILKVAPINDFGGNYRIRRVKLLQLDIIERFDDSKKAEDFIQSNIRFYEFREKAILHAFKKDEYDKVLHLCVEGLEIDKGYAGIENKWQKYRYLAYEKLGDIEKQSKIAMEILFSNEFEYYLKLKALYRPDEWQAVFEKIMLRFEKQAYKQSAYVQILIEEGLTLNLLEYCEENLSQTEDLYKHFIDKHYEETNQLFIRYIKQEALMASDRKKYKRVCAKIKNYKKVFGKTQADRIIGELKEVHCRRPAFLDELSRVK